MYSGTPIRRYARIAGVMVMLAMGQEALAEEAPLSRLSQTLEGSLSAQGEELSILLDQAPVDEAKPLIAGGSRSAGAASPRLLAHPDGRTFEIFDAKTLLSRDEDRDGFYHRLMVNFDPDVTSGGKAWVYARLYLSLEGGPWNHYFTTDVFTIEGDTGDDDYDVVTRLMDGYPSGYYDVLIELYDADYDLLVASYGPYEDRDLAVLPLEDSYRDREGGGGALGPGLLLGLLVVSMAHGVRNRAGGMPS